ncbi:hypothetical protein CUMW_125360 [Citrus unshiu]|nr:hypothetical protein CUMW_125360 [Citrus unshiu]
MGSDGNTGSIKLQVKEMKIETENKEVSCIRGGGAQSDDNLLLHSVHLTISTWYQSQLWLQYILLHHLIQFIMPPLIQAQSPSHSTLLLEKFIDDSVTPPPSHIAQRIGDDLRSVENPEYVTWRSQDQMLLGWLLSSMSEGIISLVFSLETSLEAYAMLLTQEARIEQQAHMLAGMDVKHNFEANLVQNRGFKKGFISGGKNFGGYGYNPGFGNTGYYGFGGYKGNSGGAGVNGGNSSGVNFQQRGDWDKVLEIIGNEKNDSLTEIHLERLQVSDVGLAAISKCSSIENLHIVKTPECSNIGLACVAEKCSSLRKLHIDGWRSNRIGDEALIAVAKHCPDLQELVLIGVNATHLSLTAIACSCQKLERLALCGSGTIGDAEMACISAKCVALKKLCIKGCAISDLGIEALAWGCPSLVKIKVKKCRGVSGEVAEWLKERRGSLVVNLDAEVVDGLDASVSDGGIQESGLEFPMMAGQENGADASTNGLGRLAFFRVKLGLFAGRNLVPCAFRRWSNAESSSNENL